jgi:hypothetical protein
MVPALLLPAKPPDAAWPEAALAGTAPVEAPPVETIPADEAPANVAAVEAFSADVAPVEAPSADVAAVEASPAEAVPADEARAETPSADVAPADEAPVEVPPDEKAPGEAAPDEKAPACAVRTEVAAVEVPPVEVPPADEVSAEVPPAEAPPADEVPAEAPPEIPVEAPPVEVPPVEVAAVDEVSAEAPPTEVTPVEVAAAEAPPVEAPPAEAPPVEVTPVEVAAVEVTPVEAPPADELAPAKAAPLGVAQPGAAPADALPPGWAQRGTARPAEPGWGTVLATTVRLWTRRRLTNPRWRVAFVLLLAVVVIGAVAIPIVLSQGSPSGQSASRGESPASGSAGAVTAAAVRRQSALWVAHQVGGAVVVACDPAMCGALQHAGIAAGRLLVLRPGQGDPLGSEVLLVTAAVRSQFGSRLTSVYAPVVLAAFGSGTARIEVRVVAPDGAAAYQAQLAADVRARKAAATAVLHNRSIRVGPIARSQISSGQVDPRLLLIVVTLSHAYPVDIISFGSQASGATAGVPLRSAEITGAVPGPGHRPASMKALRAFLNAQRTPYRPATVSTVRFGSRTVLDVEYPAPSPLGLLGSHG